MLCWSWAVTPFWLSCVPSLRVQFVADDPYPPTPRTPVPPTPRTPVPLCDHRHPSSAVPCSLQACYSLHKIVFPATHALAATLPAGFKCTAKLQVRARTGGCACARRLCDCDCDCVVCTCVCVSVCVCMWESKSVPVPVPPLTTSAAFPPSPAVPCDWSGERGQQLPGPGGEAGLAGASSCGARRHSPRQHADGEHVCRHARRGRRELVRR